MHNHTPSFSNPVEIIILKQVHNYPEFRAICKRILALSDLTSDEQIIFNHIAESQYEIAKYIEQHRNFPIIEENSPAFSLKSLNKKMQKELLKKKEITNQLFSNGLPKDFENLTFKQKKFFASFSGVEYALYQNIISTTYSDDLTYINNHKKFAEPMSTSIHNQALIHQICEFLTLQQATKVATITNAKQVIVIYGKMHFFEDLMVCFPKFTLKTIQTVNDDLQLKETFYNSLIHSRPHVNGEQLALGFSRKLAFSSGYEIDPLVIEIAREIFSGFCNTLSFFAKCCPTSNDFSPKNQEITSKLAKKD